MDGQSTDPALPPSARGRARRRRAQPSVTSVDEHHDGEIHGRRVAQIEAGIQSPAPTNPAAARNVQPRIRAITVLATSTIAR